MNKLLPRSKTAAPSFTLYVRRNGFVFAKFRRNRSEDSKEDYILYLNNWVTQI